MYCKAAIRVTGSQYVPRGSAIQLVCNATARGDPPLDMYWLKDGRVIVSDAQSGLIITKKTESSTLVSVLAVRHSRMTDAGRYTCHSSDNDEASIVVHVFNGQSTQLNSNLLITLQPKGWSTKANEYQKHKLNTITHKNISTFIEHQLL